MVFDGDVREMDGIFHRQDGFDFSREDPVEARGLGVNSFVLNMNIYIYKYISYYINIYIYILVYLNMSYSCILICICLIYLIIY